MPRRKIQDLIAEDPKYGGSFVVVSQAPSSAEPAAPAAEPPSEPSDQPAGTVAPASPGGAGEGATEAPQVQRPAARPARRAIEPPARVAPAPPPTPAPSLRSRKPKPSESRPRTVVSLRVRPLAAQADRIDATGFPPRKLLRAAWRKATQGWTLEPTFAPPSLEERAGEADHVFQTSLTVDAGTLAALARAHDPLGIEGSWWLIRGQIEPAFWAALDALLAQLAKPDPT